MPRINFLSSGLSVQGAKNSAAFLDMIAWSEGTSRIESSDDGYNVLVGSTPTHPHLFASYADHPRQLIKINEQLTSSAAGRYQLLARYFDAYRQMLDLSDFSPVSQDKIAWQQIRECKAHQLIESGNFGAAVSLCSRIWASLPGAIYGQRTNTIADLYTQFVQAGGIIEGS